MKKVTSILLALVLMFSFSLSVSADSKIWVESATVYAARYSGGAVTTVGAANTKSFELGVGTAFHTLTSTQVNSNHTGYRVTLNLGNASAVKNIKVYTNNGDLIKTFSASGLTNQITFYVSNSLMSGGRLLMRVEGYNGSNSKQGFCFYQLNE